MLTLQATDTLIDCTVLILARSQSWFRGERVRYWIYCWNLDAIIIQKVSFAPLSDTTGCPGAHSVRYLQAFRVMLAARKRRKKERAAVAFVAQAEESATVTNLQKKLQASRVSMRQRPPLRMFDLETMQARVR